MNHDESNAARANPFAVSTAVGNAPAAATPTGQTEQQRAVAEVQAAMMIARMNPRDQVAAMDRILNACTRPTLAEHAMYSYSRGGTDITGPSIRLAEAMAQAWGNLQYGVRELDQRPGESTVQAFAWDCETNVRREVTFQVRHERHTRSGIKRLTDPRDIYELAANQGARRLRACLLGVIPGDVTDAAVKQCETTLRTSVEITEETVRKLAAAFAELGVTRDALEKRLQRRLDAMTPAQYVGLRKIFTSLRDGMSVPGDWFDVESAGQRATADINAQVAERAGKRKPEAKLAEPPAGVDTEQFANELREGE